jgi:hypothetical protein
VSLFPRAAHSATETITLTVTSTRGLGRRTLLPHRPTYALAAPTGIVGGAMGLMATIDDRYTFFPIRPELDYHFIPRCEPGGKGLVLERRTGRPPANGAALLAALKAYARSAISTLCSCIQTATPTTVTAYSPPPYATAYVTQTSTTQVPSYITVTVDPPAPTCRGAPGIFCRVDSSICAAGLKCITAKDADACAAACVAEPGCVTSEQNPYVPYSCGLVLDCCT